MFAIVETGGKQYKVKEQDVIKIEKLNASVGEEVTLDKVIALADVNNNIVFTHNAIVTASVLEQCRNDKIIVFKKKRRKNYRRKNGHRQYMTVLRVTKINNME
ncbi:ribosomal protein L21 [Ehrlichia chaffeensis str. Heartland]|uniref:Large ribosomal subunit protein bL21 n=1 Tax=Ehrlichia chaffeensis (strain ATCC CRL-10679 / Arkansas) TaxID=205920 RepID=RL21_EHRCR|nr:50S ribosomal protein L21 [Ehrlichia chaffeensis]Q2GGS5.1 RecName: Full=Large ribosomal subunit protein bL21; AltName: Full=50S ribosomal protein L21 [Ehrlichia chaffeensis str. Arkansas]ABD45292.1 ribosomal protein L21 [Ehrlichia chaffeensis str. Arkansas]AHX03638.1 ribosomal protein L21 [Ehrlichia chaffeensis str. Heartland]AHX07174.1 ribosomal protein L21 [Ehrlichia chaffeensis str. Osceola]AHX08329.1 ribosomal protein L21 [Ehrlichia chaffeensis str. Saint Vincent]AHX10463.1 ribosomal p